ncbi:unnamed protein product [Ceutorhynchus assimilis]|uniref:H15 domain-containing protein n=1 Tax=Ceutorhynchus assimilis TaxID=467358 RepID=A0A9P0GRL8_9CUCU|nr:unnamed protein product [Ceutorhynchus assimilis]
MDQSQKDTVKEPKLLKAVLEAISCMKEKNGSTDRQIIKHITDILKNKRDSWMNITAKVRRALDHGLNTGLIKRRNRKYVLTLDTDKTNIKPKQVKSTNTLTETRSRRRRKLGGKSRSRGDESDSETGRSLSEGTHLEPTDKGRRRKGSKWAQRASTANKSNENMTGTTGQSRLEEKIEILPIAGCSSSQQSHQISNLIQEHTTVNRGNPICNQAPSESKNVPPKDVPKQNDCNDSCLN